MAGKTSRRWSRGLSSRLRIVSAAAVGFAGLYYLSYNTYGIVRHFETRDELRNQHETRERLQQENEKIDETIVRLKSDDDYIEKVAREQYHLSKEGEQIYVIRRDLPDSLEKPQPLESQDP